MVIPPPRCAFYQHFGDRGMLCVPPSETTTYFQIFLLLTLCLLTFRHVTYNLNQFSNVSFDKREISHMMIFRSEAKTRRSNTQLPICINEKSFFVLKKQRGLVSPYCFGLQDQFSYPQNIVCAITMSH
jgi:hypothetical protein